MASVKQFQVTFDCADPERVVRFWCEVLGYVVPPPPQGFASWDDFDRTLPAEKQGSASLRGWLIDAVVLLTDHAQSWHRAFTATVSWLR